MICCYDFVVAARRLPYFSFYARFLNAESGNRNAMASKGVVYLCGLSTRCIHLLLGLLDRC